MDRNGKLCALTFDLVRGESPPIVGLDITQYSDILNIATPKLIMIQSPTYIRTISMSTCYQKIENSNGKTKRLRMDIVPHERSTVTTLMAHISTLWKRKPLAFSKIVY